MFSHTRSQPHAAAPSNARRDTGRSPADGAEYRRRMPADAAPALPDGIVVVVKDECATCRTVVPVLAQLADSVPLTVYTQDDPAFPDGVPSLHDDDLAVRWHHHIETVPTVIRVVDGVEADRTVGWQ